MTEQQRGELWFLLFDWRDDVQDEAMGRHIQADSIDEIVDKIIKIVKE